MRKIQKVIEWRQTVFKNKADSHQSAQSITYRRIIMCFFPSCLASKRQDFGGCLSYRLHLYCFVSCLWSNVTSTPHWFWWPLLYLFSLLVCKASCSNDFLMVITLVPTDIKCNSKLLWNGSLWQPCLNLNMLRHFLLTLLCSGSGDFELCLFICLVYTAE